MQVIAVWLQWKRYSLKIIASTCYNGTWLLC